jgi:SAM dependent carboxyl methyltransferase
VQLRGNVDKPHSGANFPGHFFALASTGAVRRAFLERGAKDWERFLSLRAAELRPGGRLIVVVPGANDDGTSAFHDIMDRANMTLADMVDEGAIAAGEREKMALGVWPRRRRDLLEPFNGDGRHQGLTVQQCDTDILPDAAWAAFEENGDTEALATKHGLFFRTIFAPTLAGALERADSKATSDGDRQRRLGDAASMRRRRIALSAPALMIPLGSIFGALAGNGRSLRED